MTLKRHLAAAKDEVLVGRSDVRRALQGADLLKRCPLLIADEFEDDLQIVILGDALRKFRGEFAVDLRFSNVGHSARRKDTVILGYRLPGRHLFLWAHAANLAQKRYVWR